jgi:DNA polymerase III subunit epsilon
MAGRSGIKPTTLRDRTLFRLLIPLGRSQSEPQSDGQDAGALGYLDVDPSRSSAAPVDLDRSALADLSYTALFMGTTGPDPSGANAIFAIGAIRIVGGRLVHNEVFHELADPGAPVSAEAAKSCGIEPSSLQGRPTIEQVLPAFWRFCQGTVLIANDAVVNMRLLRAQEVRTGTSFAQPIIDPVRLFAGFRRPIETRGGLGSVADRLGIPIKPRATALDLALVTAQVFLKLMPLLAERGISTLASAREASGTGILDLRSKP